VRPQGKGGRALVFQPTTWMVRCAVGRDYARHAHARFYAKVSTTRQSFAPRLTILISAPARFAGISARCERALIDVPFSRPRSRPWPSFCVSASSFKSSPRL
jgi:hypothetical protein